MSAIVVGAVALGIPVALHAWWRARYGDVPCFMPRVLCFHKLSDRFLFEGTWTTSARFASIVDHLRARGYTFIDETQFLAALDAPEADRSRHVFLTFDDGYAHLREVAWPILREREVPFHVFLVTDYAGCDNGWDLSLGRPSFRHLEWTDVRAMADGGVTFGSHTASHRDMTRMTRDDALADLVRSRVAIENATGRAVRTLSYPFGRYHDVAREVAREAGFEAAFSLYPAQRNATIDRYALRRDAVYVIDPPRVVEAKLSRHSLRGLEEMKCRAINAVAVLTPLLKR